MESFILKIFFAGLIAFAPGNDGKELTILLLDTRHGFELADGSTLAHHRPLLLARAGDCTGRCGPDPGVASHLYGDKAPLIAGDALRTAIGKGAAWSLTRSELSIGGSTQGPLVVTRRVPSRERAVPADVVDREDFHWVADLSEISRTGGGFKPEVFERRPSDIVAARLRLRSGKVFTYSVIRSQGKARPIPFRMPDGKGPDSQYRQSLAGWVQAEIRVAGSEVEIAGENFDNHAKRSMTLRPENGTIEIAILNIPPVETPRAGKDSIPPAAGQHFQMYYDLLENPPAKDARPVPFPPTDQTEPAVDWAALHPARALWSNLLEQLRLGTGGRSPYDLILCPMARE